MPIREEKYKRNQALLKDYGGQGYKIVHMRTLRTAGIEDEEEDYHRPMPGTVHDEKLSQSISRAKATVLDLALCNEWDFWTTFTLNPKKYDRTNLDKFRADFTQWIRDQRKRTGTSIDYLLIPELHQDGIHWHMHGFVKGLPESEYRRFTLEQHLPHKLRLRIEQGVPVFDWPRYREKFGWVDLEHIMDKRKCSVYATKYANKDLEKLSIELGSHMYYCSRGLRRSETIKRGTMLADMIPDYQNDYVRVKWFAANTPIDYLKDMIL